MLLCRLLAWRLLLCGWRLVADESVLGFVNWLAGVATLGFLVSWYAKERW